jgi:HAD superfamily hydrolase (TIGR01549 family)
MNKPVIKAILFDLDDTLWEIQPVLARAESTLYQWLDEHTPKITAEHTIESLREHRMTLAKQDPVLQVNLMALRHTAMSRIFAQFGYDTTRVDEAMRLFSHARNSVTLFDDVLPALDTMQTHWLLGSVTNGTTDLSYTDLPSYFSTSIASFRFGIAKPETAIFHAASTQLQLSPEEIVYVGDDPVFDVLGAKQAGMLSVWMNRFNRTFEGDIQPDGQCRDLFELISWLNTHTLTGIKHEIVAGKRTEG